MKPVRLVFVYWPWCLVQLLSGKLLKLSKLQFPHINMFERYRHKNTHPSVMFQEVQENDSMGPTFRFFLFIYFSIPRMHAFNKQTNPHPKLANFLRSKSNIYLFTYLFIPQLFNVHKNCNLGRQGLSFSEVYRPWEWDFLVHTAVSLTSLLWPFRLLCPG